MRSKRANKLSNKMNLIKKTNNRLMKIKKKNQKMTIMTIKIKQINNNNHNNLKKMIIKKIRRSKRKYSNRFLDFKINC